MIDLVVGINEGHWEWEYITKFLFPNSNIIKLEKDTPVIKNAVIVYSCMNGQIDDATYQYILKYPDKTFSLVHLSNEWAYGYKLYFNGFTSEALTYPIYQRAKNVFRQYWQPWANYNHVITIPVGWKSGFYAAKKLNNVEKTFDVAFFGQLKADRFDLVNIIKKLKNPCHVWTTDGFGSANCASVEEQISVYQKTIVVPCPTGNCHPDTFRICEALESQSIPVIKPYIDFDYHTKVFGANTPIPKISDWSALPEALKKIKEISVENLNSEIQGWYINFKKNLVERVNNLVC